MGRVGAGSVDAARGRLLRGGLTNQKADGSEIDRERESNQATGVEMSVRNKGTLGSSLGNLHLQQEHRRGK